MLLSIRSRGRGHAVSDFEPPAPWTLHFQVSPSIISVFFCEGQGFRCRARQTDFVLRVGRRQPASGTSTSQRLIQMTSLVEFSCCLRSRVQPTYTPSERRPPSVL